MPIELLMFKRLPLIVAKTSRQAQFEVSAHSVLRNLMSRSREASCEFSKKNYLVIFRENEPSVSPKMHDGSIWLVSPKMRNQMLEYGGYENGKV